MSEEILAALCPICGQSALAGDGQLFICNACGAQIKQSRWFGLWPRDRFFFQTIGADYRNAESDLMARPFSKAELAELTGSCYTDADLKAIAAGDLGRLRPPSSTVAQIMFPQTQETCHLQVNGLTRAQGPAIADGVSKARSPVDQGLLKILDHANLFISDQRLMFPSSTHTSIRIDRKLRGVRTFTNAIAMQRKGEDEATYILGLQAREAELIAAYLQGRLDHLRQT